MENHLSNRFKKQGYEYFRFDTNPENWITDTNFIFYDDYLEGWNKAKDEYETLIHEEKENRRRACPFYQLRERINDHINTGGDNEILHILRDMLDLIEDNKG